MTAYHLIRQGAVVTVELPHPDSLVLNAVPYGLPHIPFTPAFWLAQAHEHDLFQLHRPHPKPMSELAEAAAFCLLGGHGIKLEAAEAAYRACLSNNLVQAMSSDANEWEQILSRPMDVDGRRQRYRFPRVKARYLALFMTRLHVESPCVESGRELRNWLMKSPGIGYKTAGWIARNLLDADDVAIVDIHLYRAMRLCGVYPAHRSLTRDYPELEERFIRFSRILGLRPSAFDLLIWTVMRSYGHHATSKFAKMERMTPSKKRSLSDRFPAAA
jgi:thermostable 8-oxoguanine DNA glycosylase